MTVMVAMTFRTARATFRDFLVCSVAMVELSGLASAMTCIVMKIQRVNRR